MNYLIGIALVTCGFHQPKDTTDDPAFKTMSGLVGGQWAGKLQKLDISFTYKFLENGKMIEGVGAVFDSGKTLVNMDSKFGWDPIAKKTYYLDCHGHDTVYNGHIELKDGKLVIDFVGLVGDMGHWVSYATFPDKDHYEFEMYEEKGGKLVPIHVGVKLHRVK